MSCQYVKIAGTGGYLPQKILTNAALAETLDTSDEWIFSHTGIRQRHIADSTQAPVDMAYFAASQALERAGVAAEDLGMILLSTCTGDYRCFPSTACLLQERIGAKNAGAMDLSAACSGFVYGLEMGRCWVQCNQRPLLFVSTEMLSRIVDWQDRSTCILFGDGAAAVVLLPSETPGILYSTLGSDGSNWDLLHIDDGHRTERPRGAFGNPFLHMQGHALFSLVTKLIPQIVRKILDENHLQIDDISHIIPHQGNRRILDVAARRLRLPPDRFLSNIETAANTSSASIPLLLNELNEAGKLHRGDLIMTLGFGAGVTYGGNLICWQKEE